MTERPMPEPGKLTETVNAIAGWAMRSEPPQPEAGARGTSGGRYYTVGDLQEQVPEGMTLEQWWPHVRRSWWLGRAARLCRERGYPDRIREMAHDEIRERCWYALLKMRATGRFEPVGASG